jgi:WD40 repeat protein/serine/threonine protein kinase
MDGRSWESAKRLFADALAVPDGERIAFVERECPDEELRLEVLELLAAHDEAGARRADPAVAEIPDPEGPGVTIDRYKLLQTIGEGGFGTVYMAQQREPVERRVALKIIKAGLDTGQIIARFEAERQALAMMDHPNIARVLDAGATASGKPYFVMELVKGIPITEYCEQKGLTPKERLRLFIQVCNGVQHAHQKGVIHRDLKPTNVLVAEYDNEAVPKIIDFGVAKATSHRLTEKTVFTEFGQLVGTLEFMSPEQAKLNQVDVDTRSDIYSLGVLLYELLTGTTPFTRQQLASKAFDEVLRIIREEQPPKPSTRVTTLSGGTEQEIRDPHRLSQLLRGDLDWIVMRSLDKERNRRYGTAEKFAEDVQRYLDGQPVLARPPSTSYKLRKFVRRHRGAVAAAVAILLMLVLGLAGTGYGFRQALTSERDALRARDQQRRLMFDMAVEKGMRLLDDGFVAPGMLWLARALEIAPQDAAARQQVVRSNLNAWRPRLHTLESVLPHDGPVLCVAVHPEGRLLATGSADNGAHVWDLGTGQRIAGPVRHDGDVHDLKFGADGSWVVSTSLQADALLWNTRTGNSMGALRADASPRERLRGLQSVAIQPALERWIVTSYRDGSVRIWDRDELTLIGDLPKQDHVVHALDVSADGKRLLTGCHDGTARVWDLETRKLLAAFQLGGQTRVASAGFVGANDDRIVTGGSDGSVYLWSLQDAQEDEDRTLTLAAGQAQKELPGHAGAVHRLRVSRGGDRILTASFDNTVGIHDLRGESSSTERIEHLASVQSGAFHPDGARIVTAADDGLARVWRLAPGFAVHQRELPVGAHQAVYSADGRYLLTKSESGWIVRDTATPEVLTTMPDSRGVRAMAVSRDNTTVVTAAVDGFVRIWDVGERRFVMQEKIAGHGVWSVALSPDGSHVAAADFDGSVTILDVVAAKRLEPARRIGPRIYSVAYTPDGSRIALACDDQKVRILDPFSLTDAMELKGHASTVTVATFSPDGLRLATGSYDKTVRVWDAASGAPISPTMRQSGTVFYVALALSPDGRLVVAGCENGSARIWDVDSGMPIGPVLRHDAAVCMTAFAGHGTVLTGAADGTISSWSVDLEPIRGEVERIRLWLEAVTGLELREDGSVASLDAAQWTKRRERLAALGGPPRAR